MKYVHVINIKFIVIFNNCCGYFDLLILLIAMLKFIFSFDHEKEHVCLINPLTSGCD